MTEAFREPGSFRDPSGSVYSVDGRVFRTVTQAAVEHFDFVQATGLLDCLGQHGRSVTTRLVEPPIEIPRKDVCYVVEHSRIPFLSYPYEWSFTALKTAALHHLDIHLDALARGVTLSDASAFNIQFVGATPTFIDVLSFRQYHDGEYWIGYKQFCEQFLSPLLIRAFLGIPHNSWYRGALEGIPIEHLNKALPLRRKLSWNVLTHVVLPAYLQRKLSRNIDVEHLKDVSKGSFPKVSFLKMLGRLRNWISKLTPADKTPTQWSDYVQRNTYSAEDTAAKRQFVHHAVETVSPPMVWDLGCNVGEYAEVALDAGAGYVVGWDMDHGALDAGFARARDRALRFLPLYLEAANPPPSQGWDQLERYGMNERGPADMVLALAFVHHLAIARNIPLSYVARWLSALAPTGVIEFVPKSDPTVQQMLTLREDIFPEYTLENFITELEKHARITASQTVSQTGRHLLAFARD